MGWYIRPDPKKYPDVERNLPCQLCGKEIKAGSKFYYQEKGAVHAVCEWKRAEAESRANNRGEAQP